MADSSPTKMERQQSLQDIAQLKARLNEKRKVLLADSVAQSVIDALSPVCDVTMNAKLQDESLEAELKKINPTILVVRSTVVTRAHILAAPKLGLIIRAGAGFNTIDTTAASEKGIYVSNCPGKNSIAVAELVFGHLINLDRRISDNVNDLRQGVWDKKQYSKNAKGIYGLKMAIIGFGGIGKEVYQRALSFGITCVAFDPMLTEDDAKKIGIRRATSAEEAITGCDIVTFHVPANKHTKKMVNAKLLSLMNDGGYVINTSRGEIIDDSENEFYKVIKDKKLRVAFDVYPTEPGANDKTFTDNNISKNPNIYGTHHIGASTDQASDAVGTEVIRIIVEFLKEGHVYNCVNMDNEDKVSKYVLTVRHVDAVGALAQILQNLRKENINIEGMTNTVFSGSKSAIARLQLVQQPSNACLEKIESHETCISLTIVEKH